MIPIKAILVDDERLARVNLKKMLDRHSEIDLVGEAGSCQAASTLMKTVNPELIFLDIQLCGETGFDLLEIADPSVKIVFVTAYDEYAIRAFEINAVDYLLKPVNPDRLKIAIERLLTEDAARRKNPGGFEYSDRILVKLNNYTSRFIVINSITCIEPVGNYSKVFTADGRHFLVLKTLKQWEEELPQQHFVRIHRSSIINIDYIDRIEKDSMSQQRAYLKNTVQPFEVSRRYARRLKLLN